MTDFILTKEELGRLIRNREVDYWYDAMAKVLPAAGINTKNRVAGFIAQCAVESGDFNVLEENLNYSAAALKRTFARYFKDRDPKDYERNPEKLANYVYMDKYRTKKGALGNVNEGDGWKFRGRGIMQITGRNNYEAFGRSVGMSAEEAAEYITTKEGALMSAVWFWNKANCNRFADAGDIEGLSKAINGGTIGLNKRKEKWALALEVIDERNTQPVTVEEPKIEEPKPAPVVPSNKGRTDVYLNAGDRGEEVRNMQKALGIEADGIFGPQTRRAVKRFQMANGLQVDGIAGPQTLTALYGG